MGRIRGGAGDDVGATYFAVDADEAVHVQISRPAQESLWCIDVMPQPPLLAFCDFHDE